MRVDIEIQSPRSFILLKRKNFFPDVYHTEHQQEEPTITILFMELSAILSDGHVPQEICYGAAICCDDPSECDGDSHTSRGYNPVWCTNVCNRIDS